ncbi:MAG TPA: protein-L-isoaspartate(D-aspartate) O-methyltransferase [Rhizomicrobium sp.]|jgi:protein-L-isoaspartate(D-aspartate) O-methyltransferase|nr:protein-L-isoaspartate(D-aspartate) O-methyltransferase [Rhizomicrobium sp.]
MSKDPRQIQLIMDLRGQGIDDNRVLGAVERTPRDVFVEAPFASHAWDNSALPIACGQTISQPFVVAYMTQHLDVQPQHRVLEIGTGSGYQAAVLSPLCRRVYTVERHRPLLDQARARFDALKLHNVVSKLGDGFKGWPEQAPFDRIILSCAVETVPPILIEQLKPGGALIGPVGAVPKSDALAPLESFSQRLTKIVRTETGVTEEVLIPVLFVPMISGLP